MGATNKHQTPFMSLDDESTKPISPKDQAAQDSSKDNKAPVLPSTMSHARDNKSHASSTSPLSAPVSASAVNAVMGPPPPKDENTGSRWERWRRDRKEAKEIGMPSQESSGRWGVKNFTA